MSDERHYAIFGPGEFVSPPTMSPTPLSMTAYKAGSVGARYNLGPDAPPCLVIYGPGQERRVVLTAAQILEVVRFWLGYEP